MSDTPLTDEAVMSAVSQGMVLAPLAEFARSIEREMNEAKTSAAVWRVKAERAGSDSRRLRNEIDALLSNNSTTGEIARLRADLIVLAQSRENWQCACMANDAVLDKLRADKERLDWLDSGPVFPHVFWSAVCNHPMNPEGECAVATGTNQVHYGKTFRDAIDAARAALAEGGQSK